MSTKCLRKVPTPRHRSSPYQDLQGQRVEVLRGGLARPGPQRALNGGATVLTLPGLLLRSFLLPFLFIVLECKIQQPGPEFEVETSSGFRV